MAQDDSQDQQQDAGKNFANQLSNVPSQVLDTLTLGPQRRALSKWVNDKEDAAKKTASDLYQRIMGPKAQADGKQKIPVYHKGGKVRKTGLAVLQKGEKVIAKNKVAKADKAMKKMQTKKG